MTGMLHNYLVVGAILFVLGMVGFLTRRNLIVMFLSAELMLQGVSLNLVAFSRYHQNFQGQAFTIFILTVAACEAAIALVLILALYRRKKTLDVSVWTDLREAGQEPPMDEEPLEPMPVTPPLPRLTPAGLEPGHQVAQPPSAGEASADDMGFPMQAAQPRAAVPHGESERSVNA